jgi:hypothetical protein
MGFISGKWDLHTGLVEDNMMQAVLTVVKVENGISLVLG